MIIKVGGYESIKPGTAVKKRSSAGSVSSFADMLNAAGSEDAAPAAPLTDISAVGLLSLQEVSEEEVRRKKLVQQGKNMLDVLENLRRHLLAGAIPAHMLHDLERQLATQKQTVIDPALMEIIDDIEIRLAVELAKLQNAAAARENKDIADQ